METRGNRGRSIRELEYEKPNEEDQDGPPMYIPMNENSGDDPPLYNPDEIMNSEEPSEEKEDEEHDDNEDDLPRTRARSKSVLEVHAPQENEKGILILHPAAIQEISAQSANELFVPKLNDKLLERKGPLQTREVEALQKGIEESVSMRTPDAVREEKEERLAAEEEKRQRLQVANSGADPRRIKILLLGDSGVGKSSLILRWTADKFSTDLIGTVGVNFKSRRVVVENECVTAQVWDTAGQEQFHKITTSYYKGAHGIMLVFDVSDKRSQENVNYWIRCIRQHGADTVKLAVIGNKVDLRQSPTEDAAASPSNPQVQCVDRSFGETLSRLHNAPYFETSAKDAVNVEDAFQTLIANILAAEPTGAQGANSSPPPRTDRPRKSSIWSSETDGEESSFKNCVIV